MSGVVVGERRTVVAHDESLGRQHFLVKNLLDIAFVAFFVGVHEDDVELTRQLFNGVLGGSFHKLDPVVELVRIKCPTRSSNHLRIELQRDDLGLRRHRRLVPRQCTVASEATNFQHYRRQLGGLAFNPNPVYLS